MIIQLLRFLFSFIAFWMRNRLHILSVLISCSSGRRMCIYFVFFETIWSVVRFFDDKKCG